MKRKKLKQTYFAFKICKLILDILTYKLLKVKISNEYLTTSKFNFAG